MKNAFVENEFNFSNLNFGPSLVLNRRELQRSNEYLRTTVVSSNIWASSFLTKETDLDPSQPDDYVEFWILVNLQRSHSLPTVLSVILTCGKNSTDAETQSLSKTVV